MVPTATLSVETDVEADNGTASDVEAASHASSSGAEHSRFVQRIRRRYAAELAWLAEGLPVRALIDALIDRLLAAGRPLGSAMRVARQLVLERLAVLDIEHGAAMQDVTRAMTELAEATLDRALVHARRELDARFGAPRSASGGTIEFWIVGMGKLGARELNVSSDIDLIYVYDEDGRTEGGASADPAATRASISAHEYFAEVCKRLHTLIGETTEDGFVFRVDLALRPNGNSGPPCVSLAMLEEYLQVQGREWERFAWLKSRVVAPGARSDRALALRSLVTAFVYRRYLDYGVFESLRQLHAKVRAEAQRRAAGRPERANDVKLSRGGIREIEFIVQLLLIVRGGQFPEIRTRSTLKALGRLAAGGLMQPASATRLAEAYEFLRRIEHRIQYLDDQQTHLLPSADADLAWIAQSLGFVAADDGGRTGDAACDLLDLVGATREFVAMEFDALLHDGRAPVRAAAGDCRRCVAAPEPVDSDAFLDELPPDLAARVRPLREHPKVRMLRDDSKLRLARLIKRAAHAVRDDECSALAAMRFIDWVEPLLRRESYLAMLAERPEVQTRLLRLLGLAKWPVRYLMLHPGVIDELADDRLLHGRFDPAQFTAELEARHDAWERSGQADEESLLDTLRRAHHAEVFRTLVRDVEGHVTVEQVADDLSALADATLGLALRWAWKHLKQAHLAAPRLAVIAYGKLGGKELGYGSDLDLVFVYDDDSAAESDSDSDSDPDRAAEIYGAFVRKVIGWLTLRTGAGELFDIDTALRPNGNSGLLVTSLASFERYQAGRGSNTAWTWEHQALTRARWCAGWQPLEAKFDAVRRTVLTAPRDPGALRHEVCAMRAKVRDAHPIKAGRFDVKHSPGGMMDVEFAVQYLVLAQAASDAGLVDDIGNIALLQRAQAHGLLPEPIGTQAADAYRELRRAQHKARLDEQPTQVDAEAMAVPRDAVLALWHAVFSVPAASAMPAAG